MGTESVSFGYMVDGYRKKAGLTKRELARRAHLSPGYVNLLLNDQRTTPSGRVVLALADALKLEAEERNRLLLSVGLDPQAFTDAIKLLDDGNVEVGKRDEQFSTDVNIDGIVKVYNELDDRILVERMSQSSLILIQDTFFSDFRRRLKDVLIERSKKGAIIKVLLIDPSTDFARARSLDISGDYPKSYVPIQVRFTRDDIVRLQKEDGVNIEARYYQSLPSATQYICDDHIFFGILAHGERSDFTPQIEVKGKDSTLYKFLAKEFDTLWGNAKEESEINFDVV